MLTGEGPEARLVEHVANELLVGGHGRRPRLLVEQRHLAEDRAGREGGQALLPGLTGQRNLHARRALADHEQAPVGVSLLDDDIPAPIDATLQRAPDELSLRSAEAHEDREPIKRDLVAERGAAPGADDQ